MKKERWRPSGHLLMMNDDDDGGGGGGDGDNDCDGDNDGDDVDDENAINEDLHRVSQWLCVLAGP